MKTYINNGRVAKDEIAWDICDGILNKEDIKSLLKNEKIREAFIGKSFEKKISKDKWNRQYLEKLPNYAVAEVFNEDYLLYLADVYENVNAKNRGIIGFVKKNWGGIVLVAVVIGAVIFFFVKSRS